MSHKKNKFLSALAAFQEKQAALTGFIIMLCGPLLLFVAGYIVNSYGPLPWKTANFIIQTASIFARNRRDFRHFRLV